MHRKMVNPYIYRARVDESNEDIQMKEFEYMNTERQLIDNQS